MTPQERELINSLFDRLRPLESNPRDGEAERAIADGLTRAPHAVYALVQTVLVQDEALKRANARIEELQAGNSSGQREGASFLDNMRSAVFGSDTGARGSVPPLRTAPPQQAQPAAYAAPAAANYAPSSGGPSFLGTAASVAAGAVGGGLLLDGIRSMFGHGGTFGGSYGGSYGGYDAPVVVEDGPVDADYETADSDDGDDDDGGYDDGGGTDTA
jgi:hypothetical protein